jgi:hypothetical protein
MDYTTVSEIQVTRKDGTIEIYKDKGLEKFKKLVTGPGGSVAPKVVHVQQPVSKYAQHGVTIKPMTGDIFEQAELMKNASGFSK